MTLLAEGTVAWLLDGPVSDVAGDAWYQIEADGMVGWAHGAYLGAASSGGHWPARQRLARQLLRQLSATSASRTFGEARRRMASIAPASPGSSSATSPTAAFRARTRTRLSTASKSRPATWHRATSSSSRIPTSGASPTSASTSATASSSAPAASTIRSVSAASLIRTGRLGTSLRGAWDRTTHRSKVGAVPCAGPVPLTRRLRNRAGTRHGPSCHRPFSSFFTAPIPYLRQTDRSAA